ncbi:alpha-galactosidase [Chloroflexia bacterium SDU3-3]|nr:alpha-galactosidase [Chloroflexia bacterium SDU3-3]
MPIHTTSDGWVLETQNTAYAFGLTSHGLLAQRYWGARLPYPEDYPAPVEPPEWTSFNSTAQRVLHEYPAYGGTKYHEPCLAVRFADGVRDTVLAFAGAEVSGETLAIHLRDTAYPLKVSLYYRLHPGSDLIERYAVLTNEGEQPITIERALSAQWHVPWGGDYRLSYLTGRWADEFQLRREPLVRGVKLLESRRLTTSHHSNPWFALDRGAADEDTGEVWFGALAWSGNWKMLAEVTDFGSTRVSIGLNDWDFAWQLGAGASFTTPASLAGYTAHGFGAASRMFHDFVRAQVLPHGAELHKVLYNSWEATFFNVDAPSQMALAEHAAALGVELFVMDDGWFPGRSSDNAGLGDWWPDPAKFPDGLTPLIDRVKELGMEFGLWVEPEMVNPNSDLYRAHPEWVIHFPTRERTEARGQLILNLALAEVQDHLIGLLDTLLSENDIRFIKWDMNRNVSEPGWPAYEGEQRELWVRYVQGLYHVWGTLRARHPHVVWQSCSGGGGRADLAILRLADQIWVSDNTAAAPRLPIQEGFSQLFPAITMEAWVTDADRGRLPLEFRFHVSMCGSLGVGGHLLHWDDAERAEATRLIAAYKQVRHVIQLGDMYRLRSPHAEPFSAVQYVSKDRAEGVLFAFRTHIARPAELPPLYLRGLDPTERYEVEGHGVRSGAAWMQAGLRVELPGDFSSVMLKIVRVEA